LSKFWDFVSHDENGKKIDIEREGLLGLLLTEIHRAVDKYNTGERRNLPKVVMDLKIF
jgi:hypothetical protein